MLSAASASRPALQETPCPLQDLPDRAKPLVPALFRHGCQVGDVTGSLVTLYQASTISNPEHPLYGRTLRRAGIPPAPPSDPHFAASDGPSCEGHSTKTSRGLRPH